MLKKMALLYGVYIALIIAVVFIFAFILIGSSDSSEDMSAGYNLPSFVTEEMMKAFFKTQKEQGIPVSSGVAQLISESGFGTYGPGGESGQGLSQLAYDYKNLFGIKYSDSDQFAAGSTDMTTGEDTGNGDNVTIVAGFSVYKDYASCIEQRAWMLHHEPYKSKVESYLNKNDGKYTKADAQGFISGIREAGWATDISYVEKCIQHMDTYNLYVFDNMTYEEYLQGRGGAGAAYDGTVTEEMKRIADIARNNKGNYPCTPDMCGAWVTGVYQAANASVIPYGDGIDMWESYKSTGATTTENIPPGAIVCGSGYGPMGAQFGHVGIYLGDGLLANNRGYFSIETIEEWSAWQTATCRGYTGWIGWVYPPGLPQ